MPDAGTHFHVVLTPSGLLFEATDAITVLESAILADIRMPSSCRNGTCRTCMCRLISGQISYQIEWPGLSADEKKEGFILPCVAYPVSDLVIESYEAVSLSKSGS